MDMINHGLVESFPHPQDFLFGALQKEVLQEDRDWSPYLPVKESQIGRYYDTYACVTYSALNDIEILTKRLYLNEPNYSDRYTAKMSGTIPNVGNTFHKVADSIRNDGILPEDAWAHPGYTTSKYVSEYYKDIPADLINQARDWADTWEVGYEWVGWGGVDPEKLYEALKYGPVQVSARFKDKENGVYTRNTSTPNHAITLYKAEYGKYWYIFDHYATAQSDVGPYTRKCAWDFRFGAAMLYKLSKRVMFKLMKGEAKAAVYAVDKNNKKHYVYNMAQLTLGVEAGMWSNDITEVMQAEIDSLGEGNPIIFGV